MVGFRAAARVAFQRADVLRRQMRCPHSPLVDTASLLLLLHRDLQHSERGNSSMARIVRVLVTPPELEVLHIPHQFGRDIDPNGIPIADGRRQELVKHGLNFGDRPPLGQHGRIDRRTAQLVVRGHKATRQADTLLLARAEFLVLARLKIARSWGKSSPSSTGYTHWWGYSRRQHSWRNRHVWSRLARGPSGKRAIQCRCRRHPLDVQHTPAPVGANRPGPGTCSSTPALQHTCVITLVVGLQGVDEVSHHPHRRLRRHSLGKVRCPRAGNVL